MLIRKKSSRIDADLNRDKLWGVFGEYRFRPVNLISLDDGWSAMRFKFEDEVSKRHKQEQSTDVFRKYIDVQKKIVTAPPELQALLKKNKNVKQYFESLAYSHKKEYVSWILEAKRQETREKRIVKTIEMLNAGKKNPNDK